MSSVLWTEKYKPKNISELVGNKRPIEKIVKWLSDFEENAQKNQLKKEQKKKGTGKKTKSSKLKGSTNKSSLLVVGGHGIGKSIAIDVITKELGYQQKIIEFDTLKTIVGSKHSDVHINNILQSIGTSSSVLSIIQKTEAKKSIVIIDEIESITANNEKKIIQLIQKTNEQNWHFPIIFISNSKHNRFLNDIKKNSEEVKFYNPNIYDMEKIMKKITLNEKIKFDSIDSSHRIIDHSQYDIRRFIFIMQELKYQFHDKKVITEEDIEHFLEFSYKKDSDENLFDVTEELLGNYVSIGESIRNYEGINME